jgi:hypothetical protein
VQREHGVRCTWNLSMVQFLNFVHDMQTDFDENCILYTTAIPPFSDCNICHYFLYFVFLLTTTSYNNSNHHYNLKDI